MSVISMKQLLEAGVHFGHQTRRWNPKMDKYIYTSRNGIHIIDLQKTAEKINEVYKLIFDIAKNGGEILFVGTKKQAQEVVKESGVRTGHFYVDKRWLGGTLTNFKTIKKRIRRLHNLYKMEKDGTFEVLPKKEVIGLRKEMEKLEKFLGGIKNMRGLPQAIFIVDPRKERNAILEARKLNIPVFGIVDTNCDPDDVDYIIPANDDALRAVRLIVSKMADAIIEAKGGKVEETVQSYDRPQYKSNKRPVKKFDKKRPFRNDRNDRNYKGKPGTYNKNTEANKTSNNQNTLSSDKPQVRPQVRPQVKPQAKPEVKVEVKPQVKPQTKPEVKVEVKPKVEVKSNTTEFGSMTVADLKKLAKDKGLSGYSKLKKAELIEALK